MASVKKRKERERREEREGGGVGGGGKETVQAKDSGLYLQDTCVQTRRFPLKPFLDKNI